MDKFDDLEGEGEEEYYVKILDVRSLGNTGNLDFVIDRVDLLDQAQYRNFPRGTRVVREIIQSKQTGRWNEKDDVELHDTIGELCNLIDAESLTEVKEYLQLMKI